MVDIEEPGNRHFAVRKFDIHSVEFDSGKAGIPKAAVRYTGIQKIDIPRVAVQSIVVQLIDMKEMDGSKAHQMDHPVLQPHQTE